MVFLVACSAASARVQRAASASSGLTPADIHTAYAFPRTGAPGQTIAIVVPYDHPAVASDLAAYTSQFALGPCTAGTGCLRTVNELGSTAPLPIPDPTAGTWNIEAALGAEVVRGVCQSCKILLVEASSASKADLSRAVATASRLGAHAVATTFNLPEEPSDIQYAADYSSSGGIVVAATGDSGYTGGGTFPSLLPGVIAVGGTHLELAANGRYLGETAWDASTSACSFYIAAPAWQAGFAQAAQCGGKRATADIAAVADPGVLVHITGAGQAGGPWYEAGGTSLAAPIIAGAFGLAGGGSNAAAQRLYQRESSAPAVFHDVTTGSTSPACAGRPICAARRGYDGPTGLGTPDGLGAFLESGGALDPHHPGVVLPIPRGRVRLNSRWQVRLGLQNHNAFAVSVSIVLRSQRRLRLAGHAQTVTFSTARLTLGPLASATALLTAARRDRSLLRGARVVAADLALQLRGATGRAVRTTQRARLYAP